MSQKRWLGSWIIRGPMACWLFLLPPALLAEERIQPAAQLETILVIEANPLFADYLAVARDCIFDEIWGDAATALNAILSSEEDHLICLSEHNPDPRKSVHRWILASQEAYRLLSQFTAKGLNKYRERFGKVPDPKQQAKKPIIINGILSGWHEDRKKLKTLEKNLAYISITPQTRFWKQAGIQKQAAERKDLKVGETVACLLDAPVLGPNLFPARAGEVAFFWEPEKSPVSHLWF